MFNADIASSPVVLRAVCKSATTTVDCHFRHAISLGLFSHLQNGADKLWQLRGCMQNSQHCAWHTASPKSGIIKLVPRSMVLRAL